MAPATKPVEQKARELLARLTRKRDGVHPSNRRPDLPLLAKLSFGELETIIAALNTDGERIRREAESASELALFTQANGYDRFTMKGSVQGEGEELERFEVECRLSTPSKGVG